MAKKIDVLKKHNKLVNRMLKIDERIEELGELVCNLDCEAEDLTDQRALLYDEYLDVCQKINDLIGNGN